MVVLIIVAVVILVVVVVVIVVTDFLLLLLLLVGINLYIVEFIPLMIMLSTLPQSARPLLQYNVRCIVAGAQYVAGQALQLLDRHLVPGLHPAT